MVGQGQGQWLGRVVWLVVVCVVLGAAAPLARLFGAAYPLPIARPKGQARPRRWGRSGGWQQAGKPAPQVGAGGTRRARGAAGCVVLGVVLSSRVAQATAPAPAPARVGVHICELISKCEFTFGKPL